MAMIAGFAITPVMSEELVLPPQFFNFSTSPVNHVFYFPQFDDMGGTRILQEVRLLSAGTITANVEAENDAADIASSVTASVTGIFNLKSEGVTPALNGFLLTTKNSAEVTLAEGDGTQRSGPDYHNFGIWGDSAASTATVSGTPSYLSEYIGFGNVEFSLTGNANWSVDGLTNSTVWITNSQIWASAQVIYVYETIPEVSISLLAGLAPLVFLRRSRR